jgi:hypothetical protein
MQDFDNFIPVLPLEDEPLHTPTSPFCLDPTCPCKEDQELIQMVGQQVEDGLLTPVEADQLVAGKTL